MPSAQSDLHVRSSNAPRGRALPRPASSQGSLPATVIQAQPTAPIEPPKKLDMET
jgi:hypothetical protein